MADLLCERRDVFLLCIVVQAPAWHSVQGFSLSHHWSRGWGVRVNGTDKTLPLWVLIFWLGGSSR